MHINSLKRLQKSNPSSTEPFHFVQAFINGISFLTLLIVSGRALSALDVYCKDQGKSAVKIGSYAPVFLMPNQLINKTNYTPLVVLVFYPSS